MQRPLFLIAPLLVVLPLIAGAGLPGKGPVPPSDPRTATGATATPGGQAPSESAEPESPVPVPEEKPKANAREEGTEPPAAAPASRPALPASGPTAETEPGDHSAKDFDLGGTSALGDRMGSQIEAVDPKAYAACITGLKAIGATFSETSRIAEGPSCGIDRPVEVEELLPGIRLMPKGVLRCETALQLSRLTRDLLIPAASATFRDQPKLTGIQQASTYVCRKRNGAEDGKLSEHALGNGIDIAGLHFGKEDIPVILAKQDDGTPEAAFQRAFNAMACLYFTTVLSPGSDATHQDHMHLDVIKRKSGFRYCR